MLKRFAIVFLILNVVFYSTAFAELCHHESGKSHVVDGSEHSCTSVQVEQQPLESSCGHHHQHNEGENRHNHSHGEDSEPQCADKEQHEHCSHDYVEIEWLGVLSLSKDLLKAPSIVEIHILNSVLFANGPSKKCLDSYRISCDRAPPTVNTGIHQFIDRIRLRL